MKIKFKNLSYLAGVALAAALIAGCETTATSGGDEGAPADPVAQAASTAEEALRTANTAAYDAAQAKDMAAQAMEAAKAAQACCDANTERMNRMFGKSMSTK